MESVIVFIEFMILFFIKIKLSISRVIMVVIKLISDVCLVKWVCCLVLVVMGWICIYGWLYFIKYVSNNFNRFKIRYGMNNWVYLILVMVLIRKIVVVLGVYNVLSVNLWVMVVVEKWVVFLIWCLILLFRIDRIMVMVFMERIFDSRCVIIMMKVKVCLGLWMCFCMNVLIVVW